jgi:hypothetical protein
MTSNVGMQRRYGSAAVRYEGSNPVDFGRLSTGRAGMARRALTYVMLAVVTRS